MNQLHTTIASFLAQTPAPAPGAGGAQGFGGMIIPMLLMFGVMYFLIIRPQQKRQRETVQMQGGLKEGDEVITVSGVYGTIVSVQEKTVGLRIADNVKIKVERSGIASTVKPESSPAKA
jgi:preprotein translocase subunit YajC